MKKILIFVFLIGSLVVLAQKQTNNWYFGNKSGINFDDLGNVIALNDGKMSTSEGCSSVSDCDGSLMFYTDGVKVWNKNHQQMSNGFGLKGDVSSSQSATIVKKPGSADLFYIFTTAAFGGKVHYSIVNMSLNAGLGDVVLKNTEILNLGGEGLTIIQKTNEDACWIVTKDISNNVFRSFLLDTSGVSAFSVISSVSNSFSRLGCLNSSPNGTRIVDCSYETDSSYYYDFNPVSGLVFNERLLYQNNGINQNDQVNPYDATFSSNGKVIYLSCSTNNINIPKGKILQYNLEAIDVPMSVFEVFVSNSSTFGAIEMGSNNKIYCLTGQLNHLSVINNPNNLGASCSFNPKEIYLGQFISSLSLPSFPNVYFSKSMDVDSVCFGDNTKFYLNGYSALPIGVFWDFGDGNTSTVFNAEHIYSSVGEYTVVLNGVLDDCGNTFSKKITIYDLPVYNAIANKNICGNQEDNFDLIGLNGAVFGSQSSSIFDVNYFTSQIDLDTNLNSIENLSLNIGVNEVFVKIFNKKNPFCYNEGSFEINLFQQPDVNLKDLYYLCEGQELEVSVNDDFVSYLWSNGSVAPSVIISAEGSYQLTVQTSNCIFTKYFEVKLSSIAAISSVIIDDLQANNSVTVIANGQGDYLYSLDGLSFQRSNTFYNVSEGYGVVYAKDVNGCGIAEKDFVVLNYPLFFTPNNDGFNDVWKIQFADNEPELSFEIFDRYGKLIKKIKNIEKGWDGMYNSRLAFADDYWFVITRKDGRVYKGHFSLIR